MCLPFPKSQQQLLRALERSYWRMNLQLLTLSLLFSKKIQFPNLVDLKLASINVEKIWPNQLTELSPWITNLTRLIIDTCENLSYLFTSSMVESLAKLIHIEIRDCKSMKEVIVTNREEMKSIMLFPRLDSIKLKGLPSLRRFCTAKFIECPSLKHLRIKNCPQLQAFISSSRSTYAGTSGQANSTLFDEKILFPNLENLRITNMHTLKMIWNDELCVDSFYRLKVLEVEHGKELLKVFPSKQLLRFKNLERLMVKDCNLVEEVFDLQVLMKIQEETDVAATTQTQLRYLIARELPNLKNVWNGDPSGILSFHNLQNVHAWDCPNLKELFPFSIAQSLPQLELLNIDGCGMEEIVAKEERAEATPKFTFGRLKSLYLWRLNGLKSFYSENHILECPQLEKLSVYGCDKLEIFTSEPGDLQTMDLEKQETQLKIQVPQPFFSFRKIIPNLKHLSLGNKDTSTIRQGQFPAHKLEFLELSCFLDGSTDSAFGLIHKFPNIKKLTLAASSFKVLFQHGILGEAEGALARLQFLKLETLPHMSHIWSEDCPPDHVFQNLEVLVVGGCPSLIILAPSTASFQNLSTLDVRRCDQLVNLVASSTANSMGNLTKLTVRDSNMLKEIVANEGNEYQSHSQPQIILSKLVTLELCGLKNLTSFCSIASCTIKLPSLNDLVVAQCPNMKIFSQGVITSPELKRVYQTQDRDKWLWIGDLNTTIKQLYEEMVGFSGLQHLKLSEFPRLNKSGTTNFPYSYSAI
ncbi:uncharacterized protein LOC105647850 isoform X2 [Jatropha curcas]|uniref:uncharacterized protein LOC105647850 isoform X2 n=1 Tax=Jatropha curcas TaxID=180498 RepID=UPI0018930E90|nr:uncharacterized protein LOC105647850 isoform X2 [Jatropha curcas]